MCLRAAAHWALASLPAGWGLLLKACNVDEITRGASGRAWQMLTVHERCTNSITPEAVFTNPARCPLLLPGCLAEAGKAAHKGLQQQPGHLARLAGWLAGCG